ncbi:MAG: Rrf2 family transcriptional regulator [Oscillatoriales cyanobacterium]|nr:MAG: Rrf2 family transcriptional regulator [Oscillatoriales cyanobacterium]TAF00403.1 MAG: Rrf2 family transcriptional regulator [Oscillatoriales cyanobacterium]TAF21898.1 MAG: Rrf2 family transcriptional regulator [Oscillatoriales cyanobacterium]TAF38257.1 MAG: Rrf2 family transcriptional regulator [Oscillatoriales cyanobacterium]TAF54142.1 MAG: Rrf2 family transcriptional regulator [Oscillatoriales cyanobacterium]
MGNVELSSRVEYALLALLELASRHPKESPLTVNEITAFQEIPERYLDQILAVLRRAGIVQSLRGAKGGYLLAKEPWQITLLEVFSTLEGSGSDQTQKVSESATIEKTAVLEIWQEAQQASWGVLEKYTLQDLCEQRDVRKQANPMYYI